MRELESGQTGRTRTAALVQETKTLQEPHGRDTQKVQDISTAKISVQ